MEQDGKVTNRKTIKQNFLKNINMQYDQTRGKFTGKRNKKMSNLHRRMKKEKIENYTKIRNEIMSKFKLKNKRKKIEKNKTKRKNYRKLDEERKRN